MTDFTILSQKVEKQFNQMSKDMLYVVDVDKHEIFDTYLAAFPEGTNPVYKERTEHDCNCCKSFIRDIGAVVSIKDGFISTVWDVEGDDLGFYSVVAEAMAAYIRSKPVKSVYYTDQAKKGAKITRKAEEDGSIIKFDHFFCEVPKRFVVNDIGTKSNYLNTGAQVLLTALNSFTKEAIDDVEELIKSKALYRGEEHKKAVADFKKLFAKSKKKDKNLLAWENCDSNVARFKNTVIGTLVEDLSKGVELEDAVRMFESKVAPHNYKRPTALITKKMIQQANDTVKKLGLEDSLYRRYATAEDLSVNNVIFADRSTANRMQNTLLDDLLGSAGQEKKKVKVSSEMAIDQFVKKVLPTTETLEVLLENKHIGNLVSLTAPVHKDSEKLFQWNNGFGWSYSGEIADSDIRRNVQERGGRVDGVFRFSHSWNYDKRNASLMDLHVFMPGSTIKATNGTNDKYGNYERVGWNHRNHNSSGGVQDVDYTAAAPEGYVPVENITFPSIKRMPEGTYICKIHNWRLRSPTQGGFKAEIEVGRNIYQYEYTKPLKNKEWVTVAEVTLKDGVFTVKHHLDEAHVTKEEWGVSTNAFHKVGTVLNSPNHWDGQEVGNKHWFFILDGCKNEDSTRGIYNEFLRPELTKHRKVFEILGSKAKCEPSDNQLSGIGFSSTKQDELTVKCDGRLIKVKF